MSTVHLAWPSGKFVFSLSIVHWLFTIYKKVPEKKGWKVNRARLFGSFQWKIESLSNSVFERRASTGSGLFPSLGSGLVQTLE